MGKLTVLIEKYQENILVNDFFLTIISSWIVIMLAFNNSEIFLYLSSWLEAHATTFFSMIASLAGALFGFIITSISIISAFFNKENSRLKFIKGKKQHEDIFSIYFSSVHYLGYLALLSIIAVFLEDTLQLFFLSLILIFTAIALSRLYRCLWILRKVISIDLKPLV